MTRDTHSVKLFELLAVYSPRVGSWGGGSVHAADPVTAEVSRYTGNLHYRSRCGQRYLEVLNGSDGPSTWGSIMMVERCGRCERIISGRSNPHRIGRR